MAVCERCWHEARRRHIAGGYGESVTAVYDELLDIEWCSQFDQSRSVERRTESDTSGADPEPPPTDPAA